MAAPLVSLIAAIEATRGEEGLRSTGDWDAEAGSFLILVLSDSGLADNEWAPSGAGLTWTKRADCVGAAARPNICIWTANVGGSNVVSQRVTAAWTNNSGLVLNYYRGTLLKVNNHGEATFGGATAVQQTGFNVPQHTFTTTGVDSRVIMCFNDFGAADTTATRVVNGSSAELDYQVLPTQLTYYLATGVRATAGATTYGYSAPTLAGSTAFMASIEVRSGSTGPPATPPSPPTPEEGAKNISAMMAMTGRRF